MDRTIGLSLVATLTLTFAGGFQPCRAESNDADSAKRPASIKALGWMAGDWRSERGKDYLQEIWSEPLGDSMMCAFRWMKDGQSWMYELITITEVNGEITLRLKHFSDKLVGWEEKEESLDFTLVELDARRAVFAHPTRHHANRLIYTRTEDDTLIADVESIEGDGKRSTLRIVYKLHRPDN